MPLLVKILNFDRTLPIRSHGQASIGVLYQERHRTSANVAGDVQRTQTELPPDMLRGFPIQVVPIDLDRTEDLKLARIVKP